MSRKVWLNTRDRQGVGLTFGHLDDETMKNREPAAAFRTHFDTLSRAGRAEP
jgi:hypothetical protein